MIHHIRIALMFLLSAGILAFCSAQPAAAQPAKSASGNFADCGQVATDVSLLVRAVKLGLTPTSWQANADADWYTRVVVAHARKALSTDNPAQYVRDLHKACLLETA